jgi:colanic acid/amylovoran biosynthesis glycosyltransferase
MGPDDAGEPVPLNVVYLLHRFPYRTETFIVREMHWLRQMGVELNIFSLMSPGSPSASDQGQDLLEVAHHAPWMSGAIALANLRRLLRSPVSYLRALLRLIGRTWREPTVMGLMVALFPKVVLFAAEIERLGAQHVHAHFVWIEGLAAGVVRDLTGIPFTIQPHAFGLFGRNQVNVRLELEDATSIITISEYNKRHIAGLSPRLADRVDIVHCGVDLDRFPPAESVRADGPVRIVTVGRAIEKKGHEHLVDACALLAARGIDFQCDLVVGIGPDSEPLATRIESHGIGDRVRILDMMGEDGIVAALHGADIFALACVVASSGDRDGIPVAIMEAMACELPVVSTTVSGIPELVRDGVSGLLAPPADPSGLADALERLIASPQDRIAMGQAGRTIVAEGFQASREAARTRDIFLRTRRLAPQRAGSG